MTSGDKVSYMNEIVAERCIHSEWVMKSNGVELHCNNPPDNDNYTIELGGQHFFCMLIDDCPSYMCDTNEFYKNDFYKTKKWTILKDAINKRDGHACKICGELGVITAHHIVPRKYKDDVDWDIDQLSNLINICWDCHEKADRKFNQPSPYLPEYEAGGYVDTGEYVPCVLCGTMHQAKYKVCFTCHEQGRG